MPFRHRLRDFLKTKHAPILLLLAVALIVGLFTFQDYGMAWDEFLFYKYADAIGYAYSIPAHLSPDFNLDNAYGPSGGDHKNHGPAYLLVARLAVYGLHALTNIDQIALWHLVNFVTFLIGAYFVYRIGLRWLSPYSAIAATALYLTQPVLWGHAFINPKDPPFATVFIAALYFGLLMVDHLSSPGFSGRKIWRDVVITGILIGLATNIRVIGPLLGVMLILYALLKSQKKILLWFVPIALIAILVTYITWPYLWHSPIKTFIDVLRIMASYPTTPKVLFLGNFYRSYDLPHRYLPWLLGITLTEPVWPFFILGSVMAAIRFLKRRLEWKSLSIVLFWFVFMMLYALIVHPPMYDGYRHFLFILPPIFILAGFVFDEIYQRISLKWLYSLLVVITLLPGIIGGVRLHPYQYTYYNILVGGTGGAAGVYETDYWLTCYKEAVEQLIPYAEEPINLFVRREYYLAAYNAPENINVMDYKRRAVHAGDYVLDNSRADLAMQRFKDTNPYFLRVEREGAIFCETKKR